MNLKNAILAITLITLFFSTRAQVIFEAEDAFFSSGKVDTKHVGFTGDGFVDTENNSGEYVEWSIHSFKQVTDTLGFRYSLGKDEHRTMQVWVNGNLTDTIDFDNTVLFTTYEYKYTVATLEVGDNTVKLLAINPNGAPNLDHMTAKTDTNLYLHINSIVNGSGSVSQNPPGDSVKYGTRIKITATPNSGYSFLNWTGDRSGTNNTLALTLDNNYAVTANFSNNLPAFPGAEGFGALTTGGRGGEVIEVTNLNDSGTGSLRDAIQKSGARTIVFRVSGTIYLKSSLSISNGNLTIAGQTAPGDGICLAGYTVKVKADNVIIRFIRSRLGDVNLVQDDAMNGTNHKNIIIDHCSLSWSVDETGSFYDNENFTMQYCLLSESLYNSVHDKGPHGYGGIWGGKGASFHHNLLADHTSRNPRFCGSRYSNLPDRELIDFRNNAIFNWGFNSIYGAEGGSYNLVNNYYKSGPATKSSIRDRIINPNADDGTNSQPAGVWGRFYLNGNYVEGFADVSTNNWLGADYSGTSESTIKSDTEFKVADITTQDAQVAFEHILAQTGDILPKRDVVDSRIINETVSGNPVYGDTYGNGIIDSQKSVGGWPELNSTTPPTDTDHDGMPDAWEQANGLDINNPDDRNDDADNDGYTNLEEYLNSLVDDYTYIIRPINFRVESSSETQINLAWDDVVDNETGFLLERKRRSGEFVEIAQLQANTSGYTDKITEPALYTYRLRAVNKTDTSFYTDSVVVDLSTGINTKKTGINNFRVYPIPFQNTLEVAFEKNTNEKVQLNLVDMMGKIIWQRYSYTQNKFIIDTKNINDGIYLLQVSTPTDYFINKIVKSAN